MNIRVILKMLLVKKNNIDLRKFNSYVGWDLEGRVTTHYLK